ncbi:hypothetical protein AVEN_125547-1 [Araneus ventricosus]|uniref:Uncharacterized protein n=1 Tax=Araneus ventricosus TaxID=182803 RepID=A0A4Y2THG3_ARAVE|nr:hypothetical protein AVEN_125547-1 [Araneus ventricosus]
MQSIHASEFATSGSINIALTLNFHVAHKSQEVNDIEDIRDDMAFCLEQSTIVTLENSWTTNLTTSSASTLSNMGSNSSSNIDECFKTVFQFITPKGKKNKSKKAKKDASQDDNNEQLVTHV